MIFHFLPPPEVKEHPRLPCRRHSRFPRGSTFWPARLAMLLANSRPWPTPSRPSPKGSTLHKWVSRSESTKQRFRQSLHCVRMVWCLCTELACRPSWQPRGRGEYQGPPQWGQKDCRHVWGSQRKRRDFALCWRAGRHDCQAVWTQKTVSYSGLISVSVNPVGLSSYTVTAPHILSSRG